MACTPCPSLTVPETDPLEILQRLPAALFDMREPTEGDPGAVFDDIVLDETIFGPIDPTEPTPQYELARIIAAERDEFVLAWRRAKAMQLGLGVIDEDGSHQCPHAEGEDLDRVAEQYGVARPLGFSDCCLWKLVLLLLFKPGTTRWLISEICELYTGRRPAILEEPGKLILSWPIDGGESFIGQYDTGDEEGGWFLDSNAYLEGTPEVPVDDEEYHGYLADEDEDERPAFLGDGPSNSGLGITLDQAIARVKAAGVAVEHLNRPLDGREGCFGETLRGEIDGFVLGPLGEEEDEEEE